MRPLLFCRDGVLRIRESVYDRSARRHHAVHVPLKDLMGDAGLLLCLESPVSFEDEIDVREALLNLAPWSDVVGRIAHCDFDLFLEECRKPVERSDDEVVLGIAGFTHSFEIGAVPEFEDDLIDRSTRIPGSRLSTFEISAPRITDRLDMEQGWSVRGYREGTKDLNARTTENGEENGYSMSLSPLRSWHDYKIAVCDESIVHDTTVGSDFLTHKSGLFSAGNPQVAACEGADGQVLRRSVHLDSPTPTLMSLVLRCLVWEIGFYGSPAETQDVSASLRAQVSELEEWSVTRDSYDSALERGDQDEASRIDREIEVEISAAEEKESKARRENPFDEGDLETISRVRRIMETDPASVRTGPEGWPEQAKRPRLRIV